MNLFTPPSVTEWIRLIVFIVGISLFIFIAEAVRKLLHWSPEVTRKLVHILVGVLVFFTPTLFTAALPAIIVALIFIGVNFAAIQFGLLKGMHGTGRKTYGTVYYPLAFLILVILGWYGCPIIIVTSMMVLAIGDAFAAIVGESLRHPHNFYLTSDKKSVEGSATMFVSSALVIFGCLLLFSQANIGGMELGYLSLISAFVIALVASAFATAWEAISSRGFDNLTVPLSTAFVLHYMLTAFPYHDNTQFVIGTILAICIAVVSFYLKFLNLSGSVATFILAQIIFGVGGWKWTVPILAFFVLSSILSKIGKKQKVRFNLIFEKSSTRDAGQVAANGAGAAIVMLLWYFFPQEIFYYVYLGILAAVTADTWGTEIGIMSQSEPRSILNFKKVPPGTSGGISFWGTLGSYVGAMVIFFSGLAWLVHAERNPLNMLQLFLSVSFGGLIGSLFDSVLGATIQAQYKCQVCSKVTEKKTHCNELSKHIKGKFWMTNDAVNFGCAIAGGVAVWMIARIV